MSTPRTSPNGALLRFEWRLLWRDRAFRITAVFMAAAVTIGVCNGASWVRFQQRTLHALAIASAEKLSAARSEATQIHRGEKPVPRGWWSNPADTRGFAYGIVTTYATKPPALLGVVAIGQSDLLPYYFKLNAAARTKAMAAYEIESPRRLLLGRFDLAFVIVFLLPLALLAVTYHAIATERERGRLPLLAMHGVSARRLAVSRLAMRGAVLVAVVIATTALVLVLNGLDLARPAVWAGLASWLGVVLAYAAFWLCIALLVCGCVRHSSGAALTLATIWLVLVVIAPWALNLIAGSLHPLPSRTAFILAERAATDDAEARESEIFARYLHDHPELSTGNTPLEAVHYTVAQIAATAHVEARLAPVQEAFAAQLARQQSLIDRWQWLSPAVLSQLALNQLAGADWSRHQSFLAQADAYVGALRAYFNPKVLAGQFAFTGFDQWPRFAWREPTSANNPRRTQWALAGHLLPAVAFVLIALARLRRWRPTD